MVHVVPQAVMLAKALLQVALKYVYVMDPSSGERLMSWVALKTILRQIRLVLNNQLSGEIPFWKQMHHVVFLCSQCNTFF